MCKKFISLLLSLTILLGAVWVPAGASAGATSQTVTLLFRDKENRNFTPAAVTAEIGKKYLTYFESVNYPSRTGYDPVGWYNAETSADVQDTDAIAGAPGSEIILYVKWEAKKVPITYSFGNGRPNEVIESTYDSTYTLPSNPTRTNYTFDGWYTSSSGGTKVTASTKVTNANSHTLHARWIRDTISVELDYDGGKYNNADKFTATIPVGDAYSTVIDRYRPSKSGFTFSGWTNGSADFDLSTVATSSTPTKLTAKWTEAGYIVTLDPNGGDAITDNQFTMKHTDTYAAAGGTKLTTTPTRTGYKFLGWYTASDGNNKLDSSKTYSDLKISRLYAHWEAENYDLSFNYAFPTSNAAWKDNTGATISTPSSPSTMAKGATYNSPYPTLPTPAPNDIPYYAADSTTKYTFEGWYDREKDKIDPSDPTKNETGSKIAGGTNGSTYREAGDQTLYARWGYNIEFFSNNTGNAAAETALGTLKCVTGAPYDMAKAPAEPKKPGYEFAGWYNAPDNSAGTRFEPAANDTADGSVNKLYAHWTPAVYTVSFDANGGEAVTKTEKVTFDSTYPKDLPTPASRTGYTFAGWFPAKDGGTKVEGGTTKVTATSDHTLYAHWDPLELTLNFNYNFPGGITQDTSTHPNITPTKAKYGQPYGTALPARNPASVTSDEKVTYTFDGWYTTAEDKNGNPDGTGGVTGQKVQSSLPVELEYSGTSAALYARWKYRVSFYANLNPDATSQSPISGVTLDAVSGSRYGKLPGQPSGNPSKYFLGWFTEPTGGTEIKDTTIADGTTTKLYAHWGDTRTCTITLNGNGYTFPEGYPTSEIIEYGQDHSKLFDNISDPARDGYTFLGWYLNAEGTGSAVTRSSIVNGDRTLYAKWKINTCKVTLNLNYSSATTVKNVDYGTELSKALTDPERAGYAFEGWFTDQKCENPADLKAVVTGDLTLYAKWIKAERVNLMVNGGALSSGTPAYVNVYEGGKYKLPIPTWTGCTFLGWYTQETGGALVRPEDTVPAPSAIPSTLYAHWSPMDVTVTFDPNGATNHQANTRTYKVGAKYGTGLGTLLWSGYKFMGWYTQPAGGEKVGPDTVVSVKSNDDLTITLYAHWGYEVSFDPNNGNGSMDPQVAEMNQPFTLPVCTFEAPAGMRFGGWAPGTPDAATTYPGGSQYTVNRRVTFYATWTTAPIVITASCTSGGRLATTDGKTNEVTVERGTDVTFVAQANNGYELKELLVDGVNYNYTDVHTFHDVMEDHTIHAVFQRIGAPSYSTCDHGTSCPLSGYTDLNAKEWYHDAIHYCVDNVIMGGTGGSKFYPRRNTTRAELAVSLYNYAGRPSVAGSGLLPNTYSDVKSGEWHYQAIEWATREGILAGYGNGTFRPNQSVTREQLVAILWRHAGNPKPRSTTLRFYDSGSVSDYAWEAMCWGTEQGILQGRSNGYLAPKGTATRSEVAEMLKNYLSR